MEWTSMQQVSFFIYAFQKHEASKTIKINKDEQYTSLSIHKKDNTLRCKSIYTPIVMIPLM